MKIKGYYHINNTDYSQFNKHFLEAVNKLQDDGQEVEVQYKTNAIGDNQLVFSAIILGRVKE